MRKNPGDRDRTLSAFETFLQIQKRVLFLYRFFMRMDSNPSRERAATTGMEESGVRVFVGSAVGTSVGETGVV